MTRLRLVALLVVVPAMAWPVQAGPDVPLVVHTQGSHVVVTDLENDLLRIQPMFWGPGWGYGGPKGDWSRKGGQAVGEFTGKLKRSELSYRLNCRASLTSRAKGDDPTLTLRYTLDPDRAGECTLMAIGIEVGKALNEGGQAVAVGAEGAKRVDLPLGQGSLGKGVQRITFSRGDRRFVAGLDPSRRVVTDQKAARVVLAEGDVPDEPIELTLTIALPSRAVLYATPSEVPKPGNWDDWYVWKGTGHPEGRSALDMTDWLDAPAGRHGRVTMDGADLLYNGKVARFWGLNNAYGACAPPKELADKRAAFYARYGINAVRLHKLAQGAQWAGIQSLESIVEFDPEGLDRLDYYIAALKNKGIYVKFSVGLGWGLPMGPKEREIVPYLDELGTWKKGKAPRLNPGHGAIYYSPEIQTVKITQLVNLLNHKNPYTGLTYAEDPAVMLVEMTNEESIYWYSSMPTMLKHKRLREWTGRKFWQWLKDKYGSKDKLLAAWGETGGLNVFTEENVTDESWERKYIVPVGNIWFFDPVNLNGSQAYRRPRLLDTAEFLHELQNRFYDRFAKAIRKTGYEGMIETSNWQAGRGMSHYYNLHSDYRVGLIDRHNYYGNGPSMLRTPGSGTLSAGMQQVVDRPFSISEWIHTFPNERGVEGPAIFGAYGMGLQGWDVSFLFENTDEGEFSNRFGRQRWDVTAPHIMGLFPAVARQIYRGDVAESHVLAKRNVHVPSLGKRELDFTDTIAQQHDVKVLDSDKVPARTLAVARTVVNFTDRHKPTPAFDLSKHTRNGTLVSTTGQLRWTPMDAYAGQGFFTMNTAGTQAVVGYAKGIEAALDDVKIAPASPFAAIYVSAPDPEARLADADRWLVTTIARIRNDGMVYVGRTLLKKGSSPIRMEPVDVTMRIDRPGKPTVHILDHDGVRTGKTVPAEGKTVQLDGAKTKTAYYEIVFD
jgi:hypothetical protein